MIIGALLPILRPQSGVLSGSPNNLAICSLGQTLTSNRLHIAVGGLKYGGGHLAKILVELKLHAPVPVGMSTYRSLDISAP